MDTNKWKKTHLESEFPEYEVTAAGEVRRTTLFPHNPPRIVAVARVNQDATYPKVHLYSRSSGELKQRDVMVHVLVARVFVAGYSPGLCVHHRNENRADPRAENLQWVTRSQNAQASTLEYNERRYLSDDEIALIRKAHAIGLGVRQLARAFMAQPSYISRILSGKVRV